MSMFKAIARTARATGYLFNGKNQVERYFLEATLNNDDGPTELQKVTAARLTYEEYPYYLLKNVLTERLNNLHEIRSVRKTIFILDYIVRCGDACAREDVIKLQPLIEHVSCSKRFSEGREHEIEMETKHFAQNLLVLVNDMEAYENAREQAGLVIDKIKSLDIQLNVIKPRAMRATLPPSPVKTSPRSSPMRGSYDGLSRSPQTEKIVTNLSDDDESLFDAPTERDTPCNTGMSPIRKTQRQERGWETPRKRRRPQ